MILLGSRRVKLTGVLKLLVDLSEEIAVWGQGARGELVGNRAELDWLCLGVEGCRGFGNVTDLGLNEGRFL